MRMRFASVLVIGLWTASGALADGLPERIDFRTNPAYLRLTASKALWQRIEERSLRECPDQVAWDAASAADFAVTREQHEIEQQLNRSMKEMPFGDAYDAEFQEKLAAIPRHAELSAGQRERVTKLNALWARLEPCVDQIERTTYEEIDFFADPALTKCVAQMRVFAEIWQVRTLPSETWQPYRGDFIPPGERSYVFQTVLEKRGNLLLLPKRPFPVPVWFDYEKFSGTPVAPESRQQLGGLFFVFPASSDPVPWLQSLESGELVVPVSVDRQRAVFKVAPALEYPDDLDFQKAAEEALRSGETKSVPTGSLFDADGHLTVRFVSE